MSFNFNHVPLSNANFNHIPLTHVRFNGKTIWQGCLDILSAASFYFGNWKSCTGTEVLSSPMILTTGKDDSTGYSTAIYRANKSIDLTNYKTLTINGTELATVNEGSAFVNCYIKMIGSAGTITLYSNESEHEGIKNFDINVIKDVSDLTGGYTFLFEFYYYFKEDNIKLTIDKFELI